MQKRTLGTGNSSLEVSAIGLGCMGMSVNYGKRQKWGAALGGDSIHRISLWKIKPPNKEY